MPRYKTAAALGSITDAKDPVQLDQLVSDILDRFHGLIRAARETPMTGGSQTPSQTASTAWQDFEGPYPGRYLRVERAFDLERIGDEEYISDILDNVPDDVYAFCKEASHA